MVIVVSRFRVINGLESEVRAAFRNRPRLVDAAPGFLGLESFVDESDHCLFYLFTRWSDVESFRRWHGSAAHRASHAFMPKGLKLDPTFTSVSYLSRLSE